MSTTTLDQRAVARKLDHATVMLGSLGLQEVLAQTFQARMGSLLVGRHEARIADDVGGKNGRFKVLGVGDVTAAMQIHAHAFSAIAAEKIAAAGIPTTLPDGSMDSAIFTVADNQWDSGYQPFKAALATHRFYIRETDPPMV